MKKYWTMMIVALCLPILTSCGGNQSRDNVETSTTVSTSFKEDQKDMSKKSDGGGSTNSSTESTSATIENKNRQGQELYKEVLERYKRYESLLKQGKGEELQKELKENKVSPEEFGYIFTLSTYEKPVIPEYVFSDLNKDGQDELLIGNGQYLTAVYYLENQKPTLLHTSYAASAGGFRSSLSLYENGQVSYANWHSTSPEMDLTLYSLNKNGVKIVKEMTLKIGGNEKVAQVLEVSSEEVDLTKFEWKAFESVN